MKSNVRTLDLDDLKRRLALFEDRYRTPSDRLYEAFTINGVLRESADFDEWSFLYGTLRDAAATHCSA